MTDMEIETFLTVLRCGSMTAAAQALYITQPTLSARLQTLEDEVGTPLFVFKSGILPAFYIIHSNFNSG